MRLMCVVTHQTSAEVGERRVRKAAAHLVRVLWPLRGTPRRRTAFAALSVDSGDADDEWKRGSALCGGKERVLEGFGPPGVLFLALRRKTGARARRGSSLERHRFSGFEPKIRTKIRRYGRRYENPNHQWEVHLITEPFAGARAHAQRKRGPLPYSERGMIDSTSILDERTGLPHRTRQCPRTR